MSDHDPETGTSARLSTYRRMEYAWLVALTLGIVVGAVLGSVHWVGIVVGGVIAGLGQRSLIRGVGGGALAGLGIWVVFLATLQLDAAGIAALGSMPIIAVSFAIAVAYGTVGGLLGGVL